MKKAVSLALSLVIAGTLGVSALAAPVSTPAAQAAEDIHTIWVDGVPVEGEAMIMVPLRPVAEALGFTVSWTDGQAVVDNGDVHTSVVAGRDSYVLTTSHEDMVGMSAPFSLGAAPYRQDGVTYVPLELFTVLLGNREDAVTLSQEGILLDSGKDAVEIPNPFVSCKSIEEAQTLAGFSVELPEGMGDPASIRVLDGSMVEVTYQDDQRSCCLRKGLGDGDISGDYTVYDQEETCQMGDTVLTIRGNGGKDMVATWQRDGYTFSITCGSGMDRAETLRLAGGLQ